MAFGMTHKCGEYTLKNARIRGKNKLARNKTILKLFSGGIRDGDSYFQGTIQIGALSSAGDG